MGAETHVLVVFPKASVRLSTMVARILKDLEGETSPSVFVEHLMTSRPGMTRSLRDVRSPGNDMKLQSLGFLIFLQDLLMEKS